MTDVVHDTPTERARCCELAALEFDAEGDPVHAAECRAREAVLLRHTANVLDSLSSQHEDEAMAET